MEHGRFSSSSSSYSMFNDGSISSCSSFSSPAASPLHSPFESPGDSPTRELQLHSNAFGQQQMTLQPPLPMQTTTQVDLQTNKAPATSGGTGSNSANNTFVHKLYNMVVDKQYQHLIAWNFTGTSFVVCNIMEFSRDVLPKHFKHNNFSSFVRQLNMYGFHKVNKSPRGHRTMAENQIWEFSHCKFMKGRPDLLDDIKRKSIEPDAVRRDNNDLHTRVQMMQSSQASMMQQLAQLQDNFTEVLRELAETRRRQNVQHQVLKTVMDYMTQHQSVQLPMSTDVASPTGFGNMKPDPEQRPPSIYITSPEMDATTQQLQNFYLDQSQRQRRSSTPLSVHTHDLSSKPSNAPCLQVHGSPQQSPISPSVTMYEAAINTPLPPSPSPSSFMSDDEAASICSPHSPYTPNSCTYGPTPTTTGTETNQMQEDQYQQQSYFNVMQHAQPNMALQQINMPMYQQE
ncbi:HSF-type DNA-binding-domain-containing protein [Fennellomyces sp. T-0311]|nr:HSF-type DNA-binding-domain-containing protein [Fennellomyces sp. T-0311]